MSGTNEFRKHFFGIWNWLALKNKSLLRLKRFFFFASFRQGQMCSRCLRACDDRNTINDEQSSIAPTEEEDDEERSLLDMDGNIGHDGEPTDRIGVYRSNVSIKVRNCFYFKTLFLGILRSWWWWRECASLPMSTPYCFCNTTPFYVVPTLFIPFSITLMWFLCIIVFNFIENRSIFSSYNFYFM